MGDVSHRAVYPITCPRCDKNSAKTADELLKVQEVQCHHCGEAIKITDSTIFTVRRSLGYLEQLNQMREFKPRGLSTRIDDMVS